MFSLSIFGFGARLGKGGCCRGLALFAPCTNLDNAERMLVTDVGRTNVTSSWTRYGTLNGENAASLREAKVSTLTILLHVMAAANFNKFKVVGMQSSNRAERLAWKAILSGIRHGLCLVVPAECDSDKELAGEFPGRELDAELNVR